MKQSQRIGINSILDMYIKYYVYIFEFNDLAMVIARIYHVISPFDAGGLAILPNLQCCERLKEPQTNPNINIILQSAPFLFEE